MEARGTVIHEKGCMASGYITGGVYGDKRVYYDCTCGRLAQAEISFKAGYEQREKDPLDKEDRCEKCYKQGIREVVEWMKVNEDKGGYKSLFYFCVNLKTWKAKLREWGL